VRLRLINLVGCGIFSTYDFLIQSIPTGVMNLMIAIINIYFLIKLFRKKEQYTIDLVKLRRTRETSKNGNWLRTDTEADSRVLNEAFGGCRTLQCIR